MVFYPISVLILAGIREILIISTPQDLQFLKKLLETIEQWGVKFSFKEQILPDGLAQAFILGEECIGDQSVCLILGDSIFYGQGFSPKLKQSASLEQGAVIFGYRIKDAERFGVAEIDCCGRVRSLEEKP